jgi:hypothetical protein
VKEGMEMFTNICITIAVLLLGIGLAAAAKRIMRSHSESLERAIILIPATVTWTVGIINGHSAFSQLHCYEDYKQIDDRTYVDNYGNDASWLEIQVSCGQAILGLAFFEAIAGFAFFTIPEGAKDIIGIG